MRILCCSIFGVGNTIDKVPAVSALINAGHEVDVVQDRRGAGIWEYTDVRNIYYFDPDDPAIPTIKRHYDVVFGMHPANRRLEGLKSCGDRFIGTDATERYDLPDWRINLEYCEEFIRSKTPDDPYWPVRPGEHSAEFRIMQQTIASYRYTIGIHTGGLATWPWKRMTLETWDAVMQYLEGEGADHFFMFGQDRDFHAWGTDLRELRHRHPVTIQQFGVPLFDIAGLMRRCYMVVSNDSGLMHLAAATGCRTIGLFGPTDTIKNAPAGRIVTAAVQYLDCRPCQYDRKRMLNCSHRTCLNSDLMMDSFRTAVTQAAVMP